MSKNEFEILQDGSTIVKKGLLEEGVLFLDTSAGELLQGLNEDTEKCNQFIQQYIPFKIYSDYKKPELSLRKEVFVLQNPQAYEKEVQDTNSCVGDLQASPTYLLPPRETVQTLEAKVHYCHFSAEVSSEPGRYIDWSWIYTGRDEEKNEKMYWNREEMGYGMPRIIPGDYFKSDTSGESQIKLKALLKPQQEGGWLPTAMGGQDKLPPTQEIIYELEVQEFNIEASQTIVDTPEKLAKLKSDYPYLGNKQLVIMSDKPLFFEINYKELQSSPLYSEERVKIKQQECVITGYKQQTGKSTCYYYHVKIEPGISYDGPMQLQEGYKAETTMFNNLQLRFAGKNEGTNQIVPIQLQIRTEFPDVIWRNQPLRNNEVLMGKKYLTDKNNAGIAPQGIVREYERDGKIVAQYVVVMMHVPIYPHPDLEREIEMYGYYSNGSGNGNETSTFEHVGEIKSESRWIQLVEDESKNQQIDDIINKAWEGGTNHIYLKTLTGLTYSYPQAYWEETLGEVQQTTDKNTYNLSLQLTGSKGECTLKEGSPITYLGWAQIQGQLTNTSDGSALSSRDMFLVIKKGQTGVKILNNNGASINRVLWMYFAI